MQCEEIRIQLHKPSVNERLFFLLSGAILSVPLTLFISQYGTSLLSGLSTFYASVISIAVFAPLIEEFSKVYPLFYRHGETQRSIFGLALFVGLGFGIVEFITYIFALGVSPIQRIPGLFFHPASTAITAYGIATKRPAAYFLVAVALHFANNFFAILNVSSVPSALIVIATVYLAYRLYGKTKAKFIDQPELIWNESHSE